jgi:hypothetical protein
VDVCESRITLKGFSGVWVFHTSPDLEPPRCRGGVGPGDRNAKRKQQPRGEGRVEVQVDGLKVTMKGFGAQGHAVRSLSVAVHTLEVRDCAAAAAAEGGKGQDAAAQVFSCRWDRRCL